MGDSLVRTRSTVTKEVLFELESHVVEYETVDVSLFLEHLGEGLAATVTSLGVNADENRILSSVTLLQGGCKLKRMGGHHTVVVVGCGDESGRVGGAWFQIV